MFHLDDIPIPQIMVNSIKSSYDELIQAGLDENPLPIHIPGKRGRKKKSFARNLLQRFDIHKDNILRFIEHIRVPFDNNLAERDIRMMKVKRKISGGFRDRATAEAVVLIRNYISTIRKNGERVIEAINAAFNNNPWMPKTHTIRS